MSKAGNPIHKGLAVILFAMTLLLSACDSAEERAEAHYQAGLAHLEEGDVERALVEFKNVFKLNGKHKDARLTFARLQRERGNIPASFSQYLLLVEQYPNNLEGHRALAEMALELAKWEDMRRYVGKASELAPDDVEIKSLSNTLAYTDAVRAGDAAGVHLTVKTARDILDDQPGIMTARQIAIDHLVRAQDWYDVLDEIDAALVFAPRQGNLYTIRLHALQQLQKPEEIEKQLRQMIDVFPDDKGVEQMLVEHYIDRGNLDAAENVLRSKMTPLSDDYFSVQRLVAFQSQHRGFDAAIAEMDSIIAAGGPNTPRFKTMRAALRFQSGDTKGALAEMQALLEGAERTTQTRENEVEFARMLILSGNQAEGRSVVEKVLTEDPTQVEAVKLKAAWLIESDDIGDAILLLREALQNTPRDPQLMTLMARAHERNGDRELMGEMLALATEVSQGAPGETLDYARHLLEENDLKVAEGVLIDSLRQNPNHPGLLLVLGQVYLNLQDWARLEAVLQTVSPLGDADARRQSKELRAQMLAAQKRTNELAAFLNELANDPEFGLPADIALIRLMLIQEDIDGAAARLDELLAEDPGSIFLRFVKAHILVEKGKLGAAERLYRTIVEERPDTVRAWLALFKLEIERNERERAQAVLRDALEALPNNPELLMLQAVEYERAGELDQAIAVYEKVYPLSNRSLVVANNLASLLTTHRDDDASLLRAQQLARRLRGTNAPAFQDTYGWVAYRLGNYDEAVTYLEAAAEAMPDHPLVQYHLGRAYAALDRKEDALRMYQVAQALRLPARAISFPEHIMPVLETEIARLRIEVNAGQ